MNTTATALPLEQAISYLINDQSDKPNPADVVDALVAAEKQHKREKQSFTYKQLLGTWRLGFVSGTRKVSPSGPGKTSVKRPGKGRFLPTWITVSITYGSPAELLAAELLTPELTLEFRDKGIGAVRNQVNWAGLSFQLSGPTHYRQQMDILSFDFLHVRAQAGKLRLYNASVRGGFEQASAFVDQPLKEQAFFTFFAVTPTYLAARGKGGGLALWTKALGNA
ncbi:MAG: hypothetical protein AAGN15_16115 [Cyanobacteria bacterium J06581_3]